MDATHGIWQVGSRGEGARHSLSDHIVGASAWLGLGAGVFLLIRRIGGAFSSPLSESLLAGTAGVLVVWALIVIAVGKRNPRRPAPYGASLLSKAHRGAGAAPSWAVRFGIETVNWLPVVVLILFAVACSYPGNRAVDWFVWLPAIAVSVGAIRLVDSARTDGAAGRVDRKPSGAQESGGETEAISSQANRVALVTDAAGQMLQQITRFRTDVGNEVIQATLWAEFSPGERNGSLYIAFCPPFVGLPEAEAALIDGPDAEVKIVELLHHGAQLDVRLDQESRRDERVSVEFVASAAGAA